VISNRQVYIIEFLEALLTEKYRVGFIYPLESLSSQASKHTFPIVGPIVCTSIQLYGYFSVSRRYGTQQYHESEIEHNQHDYPILYVSDSVSIPKVCFPGPFEARLKAPHEDRGVGDRKHKHPHNRKVSHVNVHLFTLGGQPLQETRQLGAKASLMSQCQIMAVGRSRASYGALF